MLFPYFTRPQSATLCTPVKQGHAGKTGANAEWQHRAWNPFWFLSAVGHLSELTQWQSQ